MATIFTLIITLILTFLIVGALFFTFSKVRTLYFRVDRTRMINVLEMVLTGNATANDWNMTFGMVIRHSSTLESLRLECVEIEEECYIGEQKPPYLFSAHGLQQLQIILRELRAAPLQ